LVRNQCAFVFTNSSRTIVRELVPSLTKPCTIEEVGSERLRPTNWM